MPAYLASLFAPDFVSTLASILAEEFERYVTPKDLASLSAEQREFVQRAWGQIQGLRSDGVRVLGGEVTGSRRSPGQVQGREGAGGEAQGGGVTSASGNGGRDKISYE